MLRIGETIDRYRIEALIGQGGMAAVYRARHVQLDSEHAIKVLFITAPLIRQRLIKEGRVQANLRHPNIVSVTDVLEVQGAPALVMEYIDGPALDTWLLENRPTLEEALYLFRGILRGIGAAHERGVIHRDLKPANVLLAPSSEGFVPKVTDFGLVKSLAGDGRSDRAHTQAGMALGTPEYMSPEQIRDASDVDTRADMWALGCMLYELVCHRRAFSGPDKMSTFNLIVSGTYESPRTYAEDLPRNVTEAIRHLLEVDREKRLARCEALYDLLYEEKEQRVGRLLAPQRPVSPLLVDKTIPPVEPAPKRTPPSPTAAEPTGVPAARRVVAPTGLRDELPPPRNPAADLTVESEPRLIRRRSIGVGLVAAGLLVGAAVLVLALLDPGPTPPLRAATENPTLEEALVQPPPVAPAPAEPVPVVAVPDPAAAAPPGPRPKAPGPRAPEPTKPPAPVAAPAPEPEPEPAASGAGVVKADGDAKAVWLMAGDQRFEVGQPVRPGTYQVLADFGGGSPVGAGRVEVPAGSTVTINCSSFLLQCRAL